jgi:hypothetical protein
MGTHNIPPRRVEDENLLALDSIIVSASQSMVLITVANIPVEYGLFAISVLLDIGVVEKTNVPKTANTRTAAVTWLDCFLPCSWPMYRLYHWKKNTTIS